MFVTLESIPRDERRRRTETAILLAARDQFAELGFERTTIRSVALSAGVDPALVMQYYRNKEGLFGAAAQWHSDHQRLLSATTDTVASAALEDLLSKFEDAEDRVAAIALMRSCLTHPAATAAIRDQVMYERAAAVAQTLDGPDAELRAALFSACTIGLGMARYLIELEPLASASRADVQRLMQPVLQALVDPPATSAFGNPPPSEERSA